MSLVSLVPAFPTFLYSDITFSLQSQRDGTYPKPRSSSAPLQGFIANVSSIIQRLTHRAITGRALGITVHQHQGYRVHYEWNGTSSAGFCPMIPSRILRYFDKWDPWGPLLLPFYSSGNPWVQGIGARSRIRSDVLQDGVLWAGALPFIPPWLDGPWWTIQA